MTTTQTAIPGAPRAEADAIEINGVTKRYGDFAALDDVSLDVPTGSFTVLLGPSGSGKSTLLRAIAGIERIDGGSIRLAGAEVSSPVRTVAPDKRGLGMVFQDYALWPHMTVADNVRFALRRSGGAAAGGRGVHADRVREMLARVGLKELGDRFPNELSGGQQQRVALARALVARPSLVLFDEPLSNLDADLRERLRLEIAMLTREVGATAVYITHDQGEAFALADTVVVLERGRIAQRGTPQDIYTRPASPFVARFTGLAGTLFGSVARIEGAGEDARALVRIEGGALGVRVAPSVREGDEVTVFVRPGATTLAASADGTGAHPAPGNRLTGRVIDVAYRGKTYDYVVAGDFGTLSMVSAAHGLPRGQECTVVVDPTGTIAFPTAEDHAGGSRG